MMWTWAPWWHWLAMAGFWIAGIGVIVWAVTALFPNQPHHDPQQILDERFACGDLDLDEYRRRCDELHTRARPTDRPGA